MVTKHVSHFIYIGARARDMMDSIFCFVLIRQYRVVVDGSEHEQYQTHLPYYFHKKRHLRLRLSNASGDDGNNDTGINVLNIVSYHYYERCRH